MDAGYGEEERTFRYVSSFTGPVICKDHVPAPNMTDYVFLGSILVVIVGYSSEHVDSTACKR